MKALLLQLGFENNGNHYRKTFADTETYLGVDFECLHCLLEKGYKPEYIELEPKWKPSHGASGGRSNKR